MNLENTSTMDRMSSELKKFFRHLSHLAHKVWLVSSVMH